MLKRPLALPLPAVIRKGIAADTASRGAFERRWLGE
jgi:hypothetical protein